MTKLEERHERVKQIYFLLKEQSDEVIDEMERYMDFVMEQIEKDKVRDEGCVLEVETA